MNTLPPFDQTYWDSRYLDGETGWDMGQVSPPLQAYFDQLEDKQLRILIPGAGRGYEVAYLHEQGFENAYLLDISEQAIAEFSKLHPHVPENRLLLGDFFQHDVPYDRIIEQTFFCALDPKYRDAYAQHCAKLLQPHGKLVGLLFDDPLYDNHPPFGGDEVTYRKVFSPYFDIPIMEISYNSIKPRAGREFFVVMEPKS